MDKKKNSSSGVQSVQRALSILNIIAHHPEGIGVIDIGRQIGLKGPTAHALVKTLEQMSYVERAGQSRKYRLGFAAIALGFGAGSGWYTRIASIVHDQLEELCKQVQETVVLFGFINGLVVCLDAVNHAIDLSVKVNPGIFLSLPHYTSAGKILIAHSHPDFKLAYAQQRDLDKKYGDEFRSGKEILEEFDKVRTQGYAEVTNIENSGIHQISVPVMGFTGHYDISIGSYMPTVRADSKRCESIWQDLKACAKEMENRFAQCLPTDSGNSQLSDNL